MKIEDLKLKPIPYDLRPLDGSKSFYGKCAMFDIQDNLATHDDPGAEVLKSYDTFVCAIEYYETWEPDFYRLWDKYSATTLRHVNSFRARFGMPVLSKAEWEALPVYEPTMGTMWLYDNEYEDGVKFVERS